MNTIQTQTALTKLAWTWLYIMYYIYCIYALVITWFWVQYDQYFPSFSYLADLFQEPLGE